jgi:hypothetical protein
MEVEVVNDALDAFLAAERESMEQALAGIVGVPAS